MISAGDFRNGVTIELEGNIYQIIEFQHVKPGKGCSENILLIDKTAPNILHKTYRSTPMDSILQSIYPKHYYLK